MFDEYGSQGFVPLAINLWQDMNSVVKYYARQYGYPFLRDAGSAWNAYKMNSYIPLNYVIDTAGIVVGSMEGFNEYQIRAWIEPYLTGVAEERTPRPEFVSFGRNPVVGPATVTFSLPRAGNVELRVYASDGKLVRTLVAGTLPAGRNTATWNLTDASGARVTNGTYFFELTAGNVNLRSKVTVLR
uniref:T9SS type A sorting domain-containing protein n=1 Tax=candidate division WOR-3 bacterium TaxID=2052148 RepID=A0A7C4C9X8_UNCW3